MKTHDFIKANIGNLVYVENIRDYGMMSDMRRILKNKRPLVIIKLMKTGLVYVETLNGVFLTVKPGSLREFEDDSITDPDIIRDVAAYSNKHNNYKIARKVKYEFAFAGLYPEVLQSFKIKPKHES